MATPVKLLVLSVLFFALYVELSEAAVPKRSAKTNRKQVAKTNRATTCTDKGTNCNDMLSQCFDAAYTSLMKTNCAKTCGYCQRASNECEDGYGTLACKRWQGQGFCKGSSPMQQKRAYCAKTCKLCATGGNNGGNNGGNGGNNGGNGGNKNNPTSTCKGNDRFDDKCLAETCKDSNDINDPKCKAFCKKSPTEEACKSTVNPKCMGDNEFKGDCLKQTCQDIQKANHPNCIRFCDNKKNSEEVACICASDPYSDDRCLPQFCKANPTDSVCPDFCSEDENKSSKECVCIENDLDPACLKDTCKQAAKATDSGCKRMCTEGTNLVDEPACVEVNQTDCTAAANKFNLACIKLYDPNPPAGARAGTFCADPATPANMQDSSCKNFCKDPLTKDHVTCISCANDNLHYKCLNQNCKSTSAKKNDSACKSYCKKNPADCT